LGIGDWGLGPIPNPQSPIPKTTSLKFNYFKLNLQIGQILLDIQINKIKLSYKL